MDIVAVDRKRESSWHHLTMTYVFCVVWEEYANVFLDKMGPPGSGDEGRAMAKAAYDEGMRGSYTSHMFQTVVARKPS